MHPNEKLLQHFFSSLSRRDAEAMTACYHKDAKFHDIAFDLKGKEKIGAMWRMICDGDIRVTFEVVSADELDGVVKLVDEYTFKDTGRKVRNPIESHFRFENGLITQQSDECDPQQWANAALGGVLGFVAGRLRFVRAWKARAKLRRFIRSGEKHRSRADLNAGRSGAL